MTLRLRKLPAGMLPPLQPRRTANKPRSPRKAKQPVELEKTTQAAILAFLRTIPQSHWVRYNGGALKKGKDFIRFTSQKGHPDIGGSIGGSTVLIEVKRPGGKATEDQLAAIAEWRAAGAVAFVADSVDEVRKTLFEEGLYP